ncbi:hypothetical protein CRENBAI_026401 [Crenichthys baileyi]|uniref:Mos1 transposase HTH domain-containing protein n=1 Tax=Crenichthys baileyi TaxID=28760 RepID=A0AAV9REL6_9TELE
MEMGLRLAAGPRSYPLLWISGSPLGEQRKKGGHRHPGPEWAADHKKTERQGSCRREGTIRLFPPQFASTLAVKIVMEMRRTADWREDRSFCNRIRRFRRTEASATGSGGSGRQKLLQMVHEVQEDRSFCRWFRRFRRTGASATGSGGSGGQKLLQPDQEVQEDRSFCRWFMRFTRTEASADGS